MRRNCVALGVLVFLLAACGPSIREKALATTFAGLNAARDGFLTWDKEHLAKTRPLLPRPLRLNLRSVEHGVTQLIQPFKRCFFNRGFCELGHIGGLLLNTQLLYFQ